ncbi:hypothetical protein ACNS7O_17800 (plasmid) [Haloferacaceae archaeon DSL9]
MVDKSNTEEQRGRIAAQRRERSDGSRTLTRRIVLGLLGVGGAGLATRPLWSGDDDDDARSDRDPVEPPQLDEDDLDGTVEEVDALSAGVVRANRVNDVRYVHAADWDERLQDEIDAAAENDEHHLVVHGTGIFEPTTTIYLPSHFTLEIDDNVTLVPPADHDLDRIEKGARTYRTLLTNADHDEGNEAVAVEGGHISFSNVEWDELCHAPVWFHNCIAPRQQGITVEDVAYDYGSEANTRQFGVFISESEDGEQRDCVARRVGYDGIANRGSNTGARMIGCEAYDIPGAGIQFAGDLRGEQVTDSDPYPDEFVIRDCKTDAYITIHSNGEGINDAVVRDCEARIVSVIADAPIDNVLLRDNITDSQLLSIRAPMTNVSIRGQQSRSGSAYDQPAIRLFGYDRAPEGHLDTLTISDCFSRDRVLLSSEVADAVTIERVRLSNNVFDPDTPQNASFVDATETNSPLRRVDVLGNTVRGSTVVAGAVEDVRLRDNTLVGVDTVATGGVARVLQNGRGTNDGNPAVGGQWNGYADLAENANALVRDTGSGDWYRAVGGTWIPA